MVLTQTQKVMVIICHWTVTSLRQIKQGKNANNASEYEIRKCLLNSLLSRFILRLAIFTRLTAAFSTPTILPVSHAFSTPACSVSRLSYGLRRTVDVLA